MKKIIAAVLLAVMAFSLFACGNPEHLELTIGKISSVSFTENVDATVEKEAFVEAYNAATVKGLADDADKTGNKVVAVVLAADKGAVTLYYLGKGQFCVTGTGIEKSYIIKAEKLEELYNNAVDPEPEFVEIGSTYTASLVKAPNNEIDTAALAQYYMNSKFIGKAGDKTSNDTIVIICDDGETTFTLSYLGEDQFRVSGSKIKVDYIIESEGLAKLYTEAVK